MPFQCLQYSGNIKYWTRERVIDALAAAKRTHTSYPPDVGDYYHRYGLKRTMIDNKIVAVPA